MLVNGETDSAGTIKTAAFRYYLVIPTLVIGQAVRMLFKVNAKIILPIILLAAFAISRWPELMPLNFSAAYAIAFCAGLYLPRRLAWWIPLSMLLVTDLLLNVLFYRTSAVHISMLGNYLAFAAIIWLGKKFNAKAHFLKLLGGGVLGAIMFYFITNTAAWLQLPDYPKNFSGLIQSLTVGTPGWPHTWEFFRNTLLSGGLFTGLFVGAMKVEEALEPQTEEASATESEDQPEEARG